MTNRAKIVLSILSVAVALWFSARSRIDGDSNTVDASPNPSSVAVAEAWKPPTVTRSLTVYTDPIYCPACRELQPHLDALRESGWDVTECRSIDAIKAAGASPIPQIDVCVNGVKVKRISFNGIDPITAAVEIAKAANDSDGPSAVKIGNLFASHSSGGFCSSCSRRGRR